MSKHADKLPPAATPSPRATQLAEHNRIAAFLRARIRAEKVVSGEVAERLAHDIARRIKRMVVWDEDAVAPPAASPEVATPPAPPEAVASPRGDKPSQRREGRQASAPAAANAIPVTAAGTPNARADRRSAPVEDTPTPSGDPTPALAGFDPYAFSAVVVLTKTGRDGLLKRLAAIERPEHLKKLAEAQHLAIDPALSSLVDLRAAIVKAAEQRIANRRAAAS